MKISITSGKYDLKMLTYFGETSFAISQKNVENLINGIKHHKSFKFFTCHPYMYISAIQKLKLKENHQNSDCITSHHLGEWKTILQFGGKEWNIIAARESFLAQISQS